MPAAIHYKLKVKLIRYETKDKIDFIEYEKDFRNENPILAREEAFDAYYDWINDLYLGSGKSGRNSSDKLSREDLLKFIITSESEVPFVDKSELGVVESLGNGIGVYFVIDIPKASDHPGDEYLIHGLHTIDLYEHYLTLSDGLIFEIGYYNDYGYDKKDHVKIITIYDYQLGVTESGPILATPFDWTGLESPTDVVGKPGEENELLYPIHEWPEVEKIINKGEGNQVEFKPALLYNFKTRKAGIGVKNIIAKVICAFLNANGGLLFIGLDDDGNAQGLDWDFSLSEGKKPKDFFQNEFDQMIEHFLTFSVKSRITGYFSKYCGKDIFIVKVEPSKLRPVFLRKEGNKEFWIRGNAGNRQLKDVEEIIHYCLDKWGTKK